MRRRQEVRSQHLDGVAELAFRRAYALVHADLRAAIEAGCSNAKIPATQDELAEAASRLLGRIVVLRTCKDRPNERLPAAGYPATLFEYDRILDEVDLSDLESIAWGFPDYDFGTEVDGHLLGAIFEESLSESGLRTRKRDGIFYTSATLANFLAKSALDSWLESRVDGLAPRILDPACGAGAFLVSAAQWLHDSGEPSSRLFGADRLAQALEVAELAVWMQSQAQATLTPGDSLDVERLFASLRVQPGTFDLVIGNPPWGAEIDPRRRHDACAQLGLLNPDTLDTWEIFVALGLHALRPGGRLAFVLPDTLFSPEKAATRQLLVEQTTIEKLHALGPDWFGSKVRMGTVVVQARKGAPTASDHYCALLLHGEYRRQAIAGELPLAQLEARFARRIPQARSVGPDFSLEIFRDPRDDELLHTMLAKSVPLASVCVRARGEEMAKSGLVWRCRSCAGLNNPGTKAKGGGFQPTRCKPCGLELTQTSVDVVHLVTPQVPSGRADAFLDGDDLPGRYQPATPSRWIGLDTGFKLKAADIYVGPKILIRQAGVGVAATLDYSNARCPQSVYVYRVNPEHDAWGNEYVLAVLLSRAMAYCVFKHFGEVDPARAHAKLTHARLADLPIPTIDPANPRHQRLLQQLREDVRALLGGAALGGREDWRIEAAIRELYGLTPAESATIDAELQSLPPSQALEQLFPTPIK